MSGLGDATLRVPDWPECTWPLGCRTSIRPDNPDGLCSPHRAIVLALDHDYAPDPHGRGDVPGWRPCARCDQRQAYHQQGGPAEAAARSWLASAVGKVTAPAVKLMEGAKPTSVAAAESVKPKSGTQRWRVLRVIAYAGEEGVTDEQIMERTGLPLNTVRPRRLELVEGGYALDSGDTRPMASGHQGTVWLATLDGLQVMESEPQEAGA